MSNKSYELIVVGGGPAGYVAAIKAGQLGLKVCLIEEKHLGGVCLNWGCIPTKALLKSSEVAHTLKEAHAFGFDLPKIPEINLEKAVKRSRDISQKLSQGIKFLLKKNKVTVLEGRASLMGNKQVSVEDKESNKQILLADNIILATGAHARTLPGLNVDKEKVWTAKEAMVPEKLPESLLVVGSGAIGIEFASFYKSIGVKEVIVVEMQDRILPVEDAEISKFAKKSFEQQGMKIYTNTTVQDLKTDKTGVSFKLKNINKLEEHKVDVVLMAIGIEGNTENLGLSKTRVKIEKGHIVTKDFGQTDEPGLYAIGDLSGPPWLAHKGSHEGIICVEHIAKKTKPHKLDVTKIPGCTYSYPQIASIGYTEEKAKKEGYDIKVGRFNFGANGKALALGEPEGLVKVIFDGKSGELLGAHMIGAEVTEMIQGFALARTLEATEEDIMQTIFPHPTLSEMMHEATLDAFGKAIHQ